METVFICYPKCGTCRKARNWLDEKGVTYTVRDIQKDKPAAEELRQWREKSGLPLKRFFNTSGQLYRQGNIKDALPAMTEDEQYEILASDGMMVKRPILLPGEKVLVGFREDRWETALTEE